MSAYECSHDAKFVVQWYCISMSFNMTSKIQCDLIGSIFDFSLEKEKYPTQKSKMTLYGALRRPRRGKVFKVLECIVGTGKYFLTDIL